MGHVTGQGPRRILTRPATREPMSKMTDRMIRVFIVILVTIFTLGAVPGQSAPGWQVYTHPQYGFSISFPPGWTASRSTSRLIVMVALGPKAAGSIDFQMNVNVVIDSIPKGTTLDEFDVATRDLLQKIFPGYRVLRTDRAQLGDYPALVRYTTWHPSTAELYQIQLGMIVGSQVYIVTGSTLADSSRIKDEAFLLQQILITFRP